VGKLTMLKRELFYRSTLNSGPMKILTMEEMKRSEVRISGHPLRRAHTGSISKRATRQSIPRPGWEDEANGNVLGDLLLAHSGGNSFGDASAASRAMGGRMDDLPNPEVATAALQYQSPPQPAFESAPQESQNRDNQSDETNGARESFPAAVSRIPVTMRPPVIGPERPINWPRDMATLGVLPFVPTQRPPTREELVILAERHGLAVGQRAGFVASIRRHLAASMQAPGAKNTSAYYITPYLENVPLAVLTHILSDKYWTCTSSSNPSGAPSGIGGVGVVTFTTDSSAAIGKLFQLESCRSHAIDCGKLVLPPKAAEAVYMLTAQPPGQIVHRTRDDQSVVIEAHFNFATLNEVYPAPLAAP
jgi:hypothetical protein